MCGLCGILGGMAHWTETQRAPQAFAGQDRTQTRERIDRTALVNQVLGHYRMSLKNWSGTSYVLKGSTGKTALVENLTQLWAQAESMSGQSFDPLDEALIASLSKQAPADSGQTQASR